MTRRWTAAERACLTEGERALLEAIEPIKRLPPDERKAALDHALERLRGSLAAAHLGHAVARLGEEVSQ